MEDTPFPLCDPCFCVDSSGRHAIRLWGLWLSCNFNSCQLGELETGFQEVLARGVTLGKAVRIVIGDTIVQGDTRIIGVISGKTVRIMIGPWDPYWFVSSYFHIALDLCHHKNTNFSQGGLSNAKQFNGYNEAT